MAIPILSVLAASAKQIAVCLQMCQENRCRKRKAKKRERYKTEERAENGMKRKIKRENSCAKQGGGTDERGTALWVTCWCYMLRLS